MLKNLYTEVKNIYDYFKNVPSKVNYVLHSHSFYSMVCPLLCSESWLPACTLLPAADVVDALPMSSGLLIFLSMLV